MAAEVAELADEKRIYSDRSWGWDGSDRHFRRDSDLFRTLRQLASDLDPTGLDVIHRDLLGKCYRQLIEGSRNLRDTDRGVKIRFQVAGEPPGSRGPKLLSWPEPDQVAEVIHGLRYVNLPTLVTMKLVEGMADPGRSKDLGDVVELMKTLKLPAEFVERVQPLVRDKYREFWVGIRDSPVPHRLETWPEDDEPLSERRLPC